MILRNFVPGDIVRLKSGGPKMTVLSSGKKKTLCVWHTKRKSKISKEKILSILLELVESEES
jgi:uncharacterized protein YodC (DUF2158 family)